MNKNEYIVQKEQELKIKISEILHMKDQSNNLKASLQDQESVAEGLRSQLLEAND